MNDLLKVMTREERAAFALRALYSDYGYSRYKMSKFEEYDLYVKNKDFLISDNVITFTDTDGRLLALKPDVTLSIIKNTRDNTDILTKVQYSENVYRISSGTGSYKELLQSGLECIGKIGTDEIFEVIALAKMSMDTISKSNVLEISHLDIADGLLDYLCIEENERKKILNYLGQKNCDSIKETLIAAGAAEEAVSLLCELASFYGAIDTIGGDLDKFAVNEKTDAAVKTLKEIIARAKEIGIDENVKINFSLVGNMKYYNGIAVKGYIQGIPTSVLSGGQYDRLMAKMGRKSQAIGFALYLDELEKLS